MSALSLFAPPAAAPSAVPTVHLMRSTADTLSLSWLPPDKPNGVILDYEIKYHERVSRLQPLRSENLHF